MFPEHKYHFSFTNMFPQTVKLCLILTKLHASFWILVSLEKYLFLEWARVDTFEN